MNPSLDVDTARALPRLLLVEDDPVSQRFLQEVLCVLPAEVLVAATAAEALRLAADAPPALCLIDAHLPDASGLALLQSLRAHGVQAPALVHTAESAPALHAALREGGFLAVLRKPLTLAELHGAVREALRGSAQADGRDALCDALRAPLRDGHAHDCASGAAAIGKADTDGPTTALPMEQRHAPGTNPSPTPAPDTPLAALPVWDDAAALRALNGNAAIVNGMRTLFRNELAQTLPRIAARRAAGDVDALYGELHKLKAATAFVGAAQLAAAVGALAACSTHGDPDTRAHADFIAAAEALLRSG